MFGLRRSAGAQPAPPDPSPIRADFTGATVTGQVAVGEHIVQIQAEAGARVTYVAPDARPVLRLRDSIRRLPRDFPSLLGRRVELEAVGSVLGRETSVEVVGEAGIGKTALLRHIAHRAEGWAPEGIVFTTCGRQPVQDVLQFLVESCYESDVVYVPTPAQLHEHLAERRVLVVLDDVQVGRDELASLMDAAPQCLFLTAAEQRLLWGEGAEVALGGLGSSAALALFEHELGRPLEHDERSAAEAFCVAVDGHPLRLLQGAALLRERRALPPAPSLRDALAASLSESERAVLGPLAVAPEAPVPIERVRAASGVDAAAAVLEGLERRGLVQSHSPRYSIAGDPLVDGEPWLERMLASDVPVRSPEEAPAVLALLDAGARVERWDDVLRVARQATPAIAAAGRVGAWGVVADHALVAARATGDRTGEAWALHERGSRALCLGDRELAAAALGEALALREELGDAPGAEVTRHNLAQLGGGGPPSGNGGPPQPPRPRWPWIAGVLGVLAAAAVAVALATSGGGSPSSAPQSSESASPTPTAQPTPSDTTGQGAGTTTPGGAGSGSSGGSAAAASVDGSELSFGDQPVDTTSDAQSIPVANQSSSTVQLGSISPGGSNAGDFAVDGSACTGPLAPGTGCTVTVTFTPASRGPRTGTVDFADLGDGTSAQVPLSGNGCVPEKTCPGAGGTQDNTTSTPSETTTPPPVQTPSAGKPKLSKPTTTDSGQTTTKGPG